MTYEELYKLFIKQNPLLSGYIVDYRPAGKNRLEIFLKNSIPMYVTYNQEMDEFEMIKTENMSEVLNLWEDVCAYKRRDIWELRQCLKAFKLFL